VEYSLEFREPRKVDADLKGCVIGKNVIVLRPKSDTVSAEDLLKFFNLPGFDLTQCFKLPHRAKPAKSAEEASRRPRREVEGLLSDLSIPEVPNGIVRTVQEADSILDGLFDNWRESPSSAYMMDLLASSSRNELDRRLARVKAESHAFEQALTAYNSLAYLVRNLYPSTIAFPYHCINAVAVSHPTDRIRKQLSVAETLLAFVGSLVLALSRPPSSDVVKAFDDIRSFSEGHWRNLGTRAAGMLPSGREGDLESCLRALFRGNFARRAGRLVEIRNHFHHGRDYGSDELSELLRGCMDELAFLVRFPLFRVCGLVGSKRQTNEIVHEIEKYLGAETVHERMRIPLTGLLHDGLYVQTDTGPVELFPFLTVRRCPDCSQDETYFLDRLGKGRHGWLIKSFERGHQLEDHDIADGLSRWRDGAN
jgi:hypothetical protein